jgi:hypothetical protein
MSFVFAATVIYSFTQLFPLGNFSHNKDRGAVRGMYPHSAVAVSEAIILQFPPQVNCIFAEKTLFC